VAGRDAPEGISHSDDGALLAASVAEPGLFVEFYDRRARDVLTYFARRTFDAQVAVDLTAETFAAAYAARGRFRDRGSGADAWLFTIARRQLSHFIRRGCAERRARDRLAMTDLRLAADEVERVEELIDFAVVGRAMAAAFRQLPRGEQEALALRVVEGRSYAEAARLLGCSEQVVRARVSRGLRRLATELGW
jgi:RNA polymerase sigma factor (sigma-70 family)